MSATPRIASAEFAEINVTPLIDVLLVLLIVFMLAIPVVGQRVPLTLPQPAPPSPMEPERLALAISADGAVSIGGRVLDAAVWQAQIVYDAARVPQPALVVEAHPDAAYAAVVNVLAAGHRAGYAAVSIAPQP
jgi:biopolymer transport protein ExbD